MRTPHLLVLAAALSVGCADAHDGAPVASTSIVQGDTTVVTITAPESLPALAVTLDSPVVVWTPEELGRPSGMAIGPDGRITVSDRAHIYAMQPGKDTTESVGRPGEGPGEYRSVAGLLGEPDGSVLVLDWRQHRMLRLDRHGEPDSTWTLEVQPAQRVFLAQMNGDPVIATDRGLVHVGEPADTLYLRRGSGDTSTTLGTMALYVWAQAPNGMLLQRDAYPPQTLLAGSAKAGFAFSDGLRYDIRWWRPDASPQWLHIVRAWAPPPTSLDREPPESLTAQMRGGAETARMIAAMQAGDHKYSLGAAALMPGGTLWTRPIDSSYVYHPWYYVQLAELRQPTRRWEVFGPDGKLRAQVRLSSMFTPKTVRDCDLYGFLENGDGAYSVATIALGKECERLTGA